MYVVYSHIYIHAFTYSGDASVSNRMATLTLEGLKCEETYTITAGGTFAGTSEGDLIGPRSSHGSFTAGSCKTATTMVPTPSMHGE